MKAVVLRHPSGATALSYEDAPMPKVKDAGRCSFVGQLVV